MFRNVCSSVNGSYLNANQVNVVQTSGWWIHWRAVSMASQMRCRSPASSGTRTKSSGIKVEKSASGVSRGYTCEHVKKRAFKKGSIIAADRLTQTLDRRGLIRGRATVSLLFKEKTPAPLFFFNTATCGYGIFVGVFRESPKRTKQTKKK